MESSGAPSRLRSSAAKLLTPESWIELNQRSRRPGPVAIRALGAASRGIQGHATLLALIALYLIARIVWTGGEWALHARTTMAFGSVFALLTCACFVLIVIGHAFRSIRRRPGTLAPFRRETWRAFRRDYLTMEHLVGVVLAWAALTILFPLFLHWKTDIGTRIPFSWDKRFMDLDKAIHFGRHPWQLLHPILGYPGMTRAIDFLYHPVWTIVVKSGIFLLVAWSTDWRLRMQYILSFVMLWVVLGTGLAYLFSSAGPVFYGQVVSSAANPFVELLAYLSAVSAETPLVSVMAANTLWANFDASLSPRVGISAMPSMHVAVTALATIYAWKLNRFVGLSATLYLVIILVGSVHLAWHYAVDGYLSILLVIVIWSLTGKYLDSSPSTELLPFGAGDHA